MPIMNSKGLTLVQTIFTGTPQELRETLEKLGKFELRLTNNGEIFVYRGINFGRQRIGLIRPTQILVDKEKYWDLLVDRDSAWIFTNEIAAASGYESAAYHWEEKPDA